MTLLHQELAENSILQIWVSERASIWAFILWIVLVWVVLAENSSCVKAWAMGERERNVSTSCNANALFSSPREGCSQFPAACPHPFSLHLRLQCFSPGARSKNISVPFCWTIKIVIYHTFYDVDGGSQLWSSLGINFFKNKGQFNCACVEFYWGSVATEEG